MSEERLWVASVTFDVVLLAENEGEAQRLALWHMRDNLDSRADEGITVFSRPISSVNALPFPWDAGCIPWGEDGDRTIGEILTEGAS